MEDKLIKFKTHPGTFSKEELIVNVDALSKEKVGLVPGDIIELSVPLRQDATANSRLAPLVLQVENLPADLHSKGVPLSVNKDLALSFGFEGAREVKVRKVNREEVGLDLVELRFKDQFLARSDMWRFSCSMMNKCVYVSKRVEFGGMRCQVSGLWSQGDQMLSGAIVDETRVVFRSASSHFFIFIQISSEMWDFDSSGDLYFDKAQGGFLRELFQRWSAEKCSHEVTLAFFWRAYYKKSSLDLLPSDAVVHTNKRGSYYEDFYKVIIRGESMIDWTSCLVDIKKNFLHLQDFMTQTRGEHAVISHASEGNILEAINMAVNVYEDSYQNCNFQLTGQQIVLVTPGVGVFEVERELTMMTRERIIDSGVGVDLVSLSQQPLHAVPLFKFFSQSAMDNQEYYNLPHWINYSFYNPVHPWNQFRFQPMLNLSDRLINLHLNKAGENGCNEGHQAVKVIPYQPTKEVGLTPHTLTSTENLQRNRMFDKYLVNHDAYDAAIFCSKEEGILGKMGAKVSSMPKVHSMGQMATSPAIKGDHLYSEASRSQVVMFEIASSPDDDPFLSDPVSPPNENKFPSTTEGRSREGMAAVATAARPSRARVQSENQGLSSSILATSSSHTLYMAAASSAESLPKYSRLISHGKSGNLDRGLDGQIFVSTKKTKFINPFDPSKVHGELTAYHRRWVHAFPRDKHGLAFQAHHALEEEDNEGEEGDRLSVSGSTLSPIRNISSGSFNVGSLSKADGRNSSSGEGAEFHSGLSSQAGKRSRFISGSSSLVETLVPLGSRPESVNSRGMEQRMDSLGGNLEKAQVPPSSTPAHSARWDDYGIGPGDLKESARVAPPKQPAWSRQKRRPIPCERRLSNASLKGVEDFTSVQRTGVDWKSLTEPACLPVTVDFFPSELRLNQDYYQSPMELVANCCQNEFDDNSRASNKLQYSWIADHQKVDTFEAFREMISQRLSQGFQLIFDSKDTSGSSKTNSLRWSGQNGCQHQNNIFALHQALIDQKELLTKKFTDKRGKDSRRSTDVCVKLSLGKVFQELKLVYPHIHVTVYKQKVQYSPKPFTYGYNLCRGPWTPGLHGEQDQAASKEEPPLLSTDVKFSYKRTEEYNWNYLDQHVCGYPDFEVLQESHRYWRCRYLLLPTTPPPVQSPIGQQTEGERQFLASREAILISSFTRFLEFLNHVKRAQNPSASIYQQNSRLLKRHVSLPASHISLHTIGGSSTSGYSSSQTPSMTPSSMDFSNRVVSPAPGLSAMSVLSPSGAKFPKRHSDGHPSGETTPLRGHTPSKQATPIHHHGVESLSGGQMPPEDSSIHQQLGKKASYNISDIAASPVQSSSHRLSPYSYLREGGGSQHAAWKKKSMDDLLVSSPTHSRSSSEGKKDGSNNVEGGGIHGDQPINSLSSRESLDRATDSSGIPTREHSPSSGQVRSPEAVTEETSTSISSFDASIQLLNSSSPTNLILRHMENAEEGLDFLAPHVGLKSSMCFVAMEAVNWAMDKINGVKTRQDAIKLLQSMLQEQLIVHASTDLSIPFLDGYLIYCIPRRTNPDALSTVRENGSGNGDIDFCMVSPDYETFSKRWFEVLVQHPSAFLPLSSDQQQPAMEVSPASTSPYITGYSLYATSSHYQPFYRENNAQLAMRIPSIMVNRYVELNPDPQFRSDRPEWCYVRYDHTYNPRCGFQFEFQWMVTTVVLVSQLIQSWTHKAAMCGFNLIPVPMLHTLSKDERNSSPFATRTYIPLLLPPSFPGTTMPLSEAVGKIMAAILQKLGFVLDPGSMTDDLQDLNLTLPITSRIYVHYSGCALVGPTCADSVIRLMTRDRRMRTSSLGTTLGRGDFADLNYMGEIMTEGRGDSNVGVGMTGAQISLGEARKFVSERSPYDDEDDGGWGVSTKAHLKQESPVQLQCGFYWYRNMALFRHKGVVSHSTASGGDRGAGSGISSDYRSLQEKMVALCSNKDDSLSQLCAEALGSNLDSSDSD